MMNSGMKEAQTGVIEQTEFDVGIVERMVSFVQSKEYTIDKEAVLVDHHEKSSARPYIPPPVINDILLAHVEMFRIGDFYDMDGLMSYTTKKIEEIGKHGWQPDRFLDVIKEVCNVSRSRRNEKSLCDALCAYTLQHRAQVMRDSTMMGIFKNDHEVQSFVAALFRGSVQQSIRDQSKHDQIMRWREEDHQSSASHIARRDATISHEKYVTKSLVDTIPALPRDCPGGRCIAQFPSNLSFEQEIGEGTVLKDFWIISCKACGLQLKRCIGEWPVVGQEQWR